MPEMFDLTLWLPRAVLYHFVTIVPIFTTSKFEPKIVFSIPRSSLLHRGSGAPLKNHPGPLSATNMPYFFRARRITWLADFPYATIGLMFELGRLEPRPTFGRLTKFESVDASPPYAVVQILWSHRS